MAPAAIVLILVLWASPAQARDDVGNPLGASERDDTSSSHDATAPVSDPNVSGDQDLSILLPGLLPRPLGLTDRLHFYWNQGLHLDGPHLRFFLGGRVQLDGGVLHPSHGLRDDLGLGGTYTDADVRRGGVKFAAALDEDLYLDVGYDVAQESFTNVLVGFKGLPYIERVQLGNQREPFSLEEMTSSNDITFLERGLPAALVPGRNSGIRIDGSYLDDRLNLSIGAFGNTASVRQFSEAFSGDTGNGTNLTGRVGGLPWFEDQGRRLLYLGLSYSHQVRSGENVHYQSQPESFLAPVLASTGEVPSEGQNLINATASFVDGPLSAQAEYVGSFVASSGETLSFGGVYVFASYFLTGEHRVFDKTWPRFQPVDPQRRFRFGDDGFGAVEIAARYSYLDLDSGSVEGGVMNDVTLGLNWYLTRNVRLTANYIHARLRSEGYIGIAQMRVQVAF